MKLSEAKQKFTVYLQTQHKADSTVEAYVNVITAFGSWLIKNPETTKLTPSKRVETYLTYRVQEDDISASTQNVDLNALIAFHRMSGIEIQGVNALRARKRERIPPILSREQVHALINGFPEEYKLIPLLLYGCGMRINEVLRLRLKDIDFPNKKIVIHEAKGDKDRDVNIPEKIMPELKAQYFFAVETWQHDKRHRFNGVHCGGVEKKYPAYPTSKEWYWLFPAPELSTDPKTKTPMMRHHLKDWFIQPLFVRVRELLDLPIYTSAHKLRHACFTHMAADMIKQGFPEKMIRAQLKDVAGHVNDETINFYIHLAAPKSAVIRSPLEIP